MWPYFWKPPRMLGSYTTGIYVFERGGTTCDNGLVCCSSSLAISTCIQICTDRLLIICIFLIDVEYTQTSPKSIVEGPTIYMKWDLYVIKVKKSKSQTQIYTVHYLSIHQITKLRLLADIKLDMQLGSDKFHLQLQKFKSILPCQMCVEGQVIFDIWDKNSACSNHAIDSFRMCPHVQMVPQEVRYRGSDPDASLPIASFQLASAWGTWALNPGPPMPNKLKALQCSSVGSPCTGIFPTLLGSSTCRAFKGTGVQGTDGIPHTETFKCLAVQPTNNGSDEVPPPAQRYTMGL